MSEKNGQSDFTPLASVYSAAHGRGTVVEIRGDRVIVSHDRRARPIQVEYWADGGYPVQAPRDEYYRLHTWGREDVA